MNRKLFFHFAKLKHTSQGEIHRRIESMIREQEAVLCRDCTQNQRRRNLLH